MDNMASSGLKLQNSCYFSIFSPKIFQARSSSCIALVFFSKKKIKILALSPCFSLNVFLFLLFIHPHWDLKLPPNTALNVNFINALFVFLPDQLMRVINEIGHNTSPCGTPVATFTELKRCHLSLPFANVLSANL